MANRRPRQQTLKQLTKTWYKKLADSGFVDIEYPGGEMRRTIPASIEDKDPLLIQSIQEYYSLSSKFLNDYNFPNEIERIIWTYHTEGISVRDISMLLKKAKVLKKNKNIIWDIVRKLEAEMKKMYKVTK